MTLKPWADVIQDDMDDPAFVVDYLRLAFDEERTVGLLRTLRRVARIRGVEISFSMEPRFDEVSAALKALGLKFQPVQDEAAGEMSVLRIK